MNLDMFHNADAWGALWLIVPLASLAFTWLLGVTIGRLE